MALVIGAVTIHLYQVLTISSYSIVDLLFVCTYNSGDHDAALILTF